MIERLRTVHDKVVFMGFFGYSRLCVDQCLIGIEQPKSTKSVGLVPAAGIDHDHTAAGFLDRPSGVVIGNRKLGPFADRADL